ncbi:MAG: N-acetyltransferase [Chryseolinea sp.]
MMRKASSTDRKLIVYILSDSFDANSSVNYVVKQDSHRSDRIRGLMEYSFDICRKYRDVWTSEDKSACALILLPDKKQFSFASTWWYIKLATTVIGISRINQVLNRESMITTFHSKSPFAYLWFIGIKESNQNKGVCSSLPSDIIRAYDMERRPIYLETSVDRNLPWYLKHRFEIFETIELGYPLTFLRRPFEKSVQ